MLKASRPDWPGQSHSWTQHAYTQGMQHSPLMAAAFGSLQSWGNPKVPGHISAGDAPLQVYLRLAERAIEALCILSSLPMEIEHHDDLIISCSIISLRPPPPAGAHLTRQAGGPARSSNAVRIAIAGLKLDACMCSYSCMAKA